MNYIIKNQYTCECLGKSYQVSAAFPDLAAQAVAEELDKECIVEIGNIEFAVERRQCSNGERDYKYVAYEVFENTRK